MLTERTGLSKHSMLHINLDKYDYLDSFKAILQDPGNKIVIDDVVKAFFSSGPKWVERLFSIRNKIAGLFGLKTSKSTNRKQQLAQLKYEPGASLGLFKIIQKSAQEVILGEDDKHLNFRVSLFLEAPSGVTSGKMLTISTSVIFNNWLGRFYFIPVRPFHKIIVPTILKGMIKTLERH